jgi:sporulation protein YlmC with PRC-barrel domain
MLRSRFVGGLAAAAVFAAFVPPALAAHTDTQAAPSAAPATQSLTPEQRYNRRYPQPVRVGYLVGLPVLDEQGSTLGFVREVVRTADGKIVLVVPYRAWLGWASVDWGRKAVAVPLETVAMIGRQVKAIDFSREDFAAAAAYAGGGTALPGSETIRVAVAR